MATFRYFLLAKYLANESNIKFFNRIAGYLRKGLFNLENI